MHPIPNSLAERLKRSPHPPASLWTLTRKDGNVLRFTDAPRDLKVNGLRYAALASSKASLALQANDHSRPLTAALSHDALNAEDLQNGFYDGAEVTLAYAALDAQHLGAAVIFRGKLGSVTVHRGVFQAELIGPEEQLNQSVTAQTYSPRCRARFGDTRCGVNAEALAHSATISWPDPSGLRLTVTPSPSDPARFAGGTARVLSGAAAGETLAVATALPGGEFMLASGAKRKLSVGDALTVIPGCDKRPETCRARYANMINFRGEPGLPGAAFFGA